MLLVATVTCCWLLPPLLDQLPLAGAGESDASGGSGSVRAAFRLPRVLGNEEDRGRQ